MSRLIKFFFRSDLIQPPDPSEKENFRSSCMENHLEVFPTSSHRPSCSKAGLEEPLGRFSAQLDLKFSISEDFGAG